LKGDGLAELAGHGEIDAYVNSMSVCKNPTNTNMPTVDMIHFQSSYCSYNRGKSAKRQDKPTERFYTPYGLFGSS
jgi:hypothetical protein